MGINAGFVLPHPPIIMPQVGRGEEQKISKTIESYKKVARIVAGMKPKTIVLVSPHGNCYSDYFHIYNKDNFKADLSAFMAPSVSVDIDIDKNLFKIIKEQADSMNIPAGGLGHCDLQNDHGALIPLYFIREFYKDFSLIHISLSGLSAKEHYILGKCVQNAANLSKKNVVFIASGDLSHRLKKNGPYGFTKEGVEFDKMITEILSSANFPKLFDISPSLIEMAGECGYKSIAMLFGALDRLDVESSLLSYEDTFGVGYAVASFLVKGINEQNTILKNNKKEDKKMSDNQYVRLAKYAVEYYVKNKKKPPLPENISDELLKNKAGVFVTLKKYSNLRGCIGTIAPVRKSIALEIIHNAISSCSQDPRFKPVSENELEDLEYSVDVLSPPEKIQSPSQLDPKVYGVIVSKSYKKGLLLPNLDGVDTISHQIDIALQKAGIYSDEKYTLQRFKVERHK